ncbi:MAG: hypothetical protein JF591_10725, partial [Lysobacter sp.]|nr:hypothetical protein [Lysobacter sp.]
MSPFIFVTEVQLTYMPPSSPDLLTALDTRRSVPAKQLTAPGPDESTLKRMLTSAVRVPDHGKRVPFRFLTIEGQARHALGERVAARGIEVFPDAGEAAVAKDRGRYSSAPLIVTVIARLGPDEKIPEFERVLTVGSV